MGLASLRGSHNWPQRGLLMTTNKSNTMIKDASMAVLPTDSLFVCHAMGQGFQKTPSVFLTLHH